MKKSLFIVSLDFELLWGVRDKRTIDSYGANIKGVRQVIPALLKAFDEHGVKATFATVGFLFCPTKSSLLQHRPSVLPVYTHKKYSPYENDYLQSIGDSEKDDVYHYGYSLVKLIKENGNHEIASHTFSHFYCLERASLQAFEADLMAAQKVAKEIGVELKSIIFPRNQYSEEHITICQKLGFTSYRGNESTAVYKPRSNEGQNKLVRGIRLLDSYLNLTGHHTYNIYRETSIINIPASRFLRPYSRKFRFMDGLRLKRIKNGMTYAAIKGEAFHLWWHPHNFGLHLQENLRFLNEILKHFESLHKQYGMTSVTMEQIGQESNANHG